MTIISFELRYASPYSLFIDKRNAFGIVPNSPNRNGMLAIVSSIAASSGLEGFDGRFWREATMFQLLSIALETPQVVKELNGSQFCDYLLNGTLMPFWGGFVVKYNEKSLHFSQTFSP